MEAKDYEGLTALVDGDIVLFRSGMAGQYKEREVYSPKDLKNYIIKFRYMKDLKAWLKEHNKTKDDFVIVEKDILEPLNRILHTTKLMMKAIEDKFKGGKPIVYLTGKNNFRDKVATEKPYKGNRWSDERRAAERDKGNWIDWLDATEEKHTVPIRPFYEKEIKQYLIKYWGAEVIDGQEADDALGIYQYTVEKSTVFAEKEDTRFKRTVIVSVDKDLKMITGWHQDLAGMDNDPTFISQVEADRNFYSQICSGDNIDNIPGIFRVGKATGDKTVANCNTPEEMWSAVQGLYCKKDDGVRDEVLVERGQLLWIRRTEEELWVPS